jgi:hypothetical protein
MWKDYPLLQWVVSFYRYYLLDHVQLIKICGKNLFEINMSIISREV